ncbi:MAG TPA: DUF2917 domain-containing protein [Burkholderiaceae bacterium]|nr:DUF2917 domain-containing protein [Burkholderiaceae bacterium]
MKLELNTQTVDLTDGSTIVLRDARDVQVVCVEGGIWVTEERLRNDVVLSPGESRVVRVGGRTFVTALGASRVRLLEPTRAGSWWRTDLRVGVVAAIRGAGAAT